MPPLQAHDVCSRCWSWKNAEDLACSNCAQAQLDLPRVCPAVVPITLYRKPSDVRDWLKFYKPNSEVQIAEYSSLLAVLLERFLVEAEDALTSVFGGWDAVCVVPSSHRLEEHPLVSVLTAAWGPRGWRPERLLARGPGALGHRVMSQDAFVALPEATGKRVLLVDDVFTTGSALHSATTSLAAAGCQVVAGVVIGRRVNPEYNDLAASVWARQEAQPYRWHTWPKWLNQAQPDVSR